MEKIYVVTHNGKPVEQGGIRIGYQVGDFGLNLATQKSFSVSALLKQQDKTKEQAVKKSLIRYRELPRMNFFGECSGCGERRVAEKFTETDDGTRFVYICLKCETMMRSPF